MRHQIVLPVLAVIFLAGCGPAGVEHAEAAATPAPARPGPPVKEFSCGVRQEKAPEWAAAQLAFLDKMTEYHHTFLDKFFDGKLGIPPVKQITRHGGCDDDYAEGVARWDRYLLLRHDERSAKAYVHMWNSIFKERRMPKTNKIWCTGGFDPEHALELFQLLWGALEVAPASEKLIGDNRLFADFIIDDFYDPEQKLLKNARVLKLGGKFRKGYEGDLIQSTGYINSLFLAYLSTGDEKYRRVAIDYGTKWNELAADNGGIFPFYVTPDGKIGAGGDKSQFHRAPFRDFDYDKWGMTISARAFHAWPLALSYLDRGEAKHASGLVSTVEKLFEAGGGTLPATYYRNGKWVRGKYNWCVPRLLDHAYVATFDPKLAELMKSYRRAAEGAEANFMRMINSFYFDTEPLDYAAEIFRAGVGRQESKIRKVKASKTPRSGDALSSLKPSRWGLDLIDGAFWGQWDNGRCGGTSPSSIRYYAGEGKPGLPGKVAALVRGIRKDGLKVHLYNDADEATPVILVAGTYGQHRWTSAEHGGGAKLALDGRKVMVTLRAKSAATVKLGMERCALKPTLTPERDDAPETPEAQE